MEDITANCVTSGHVEISWTNLELSLRIAVMCMIDTLFIPLSTQDLDKLSLYKALLLSLLDKHTGFRVFDLHFSFVSNTNNQREVTCMMNLDCKPLVNNKNPAEGFANGKRGNNCAL